MIANVTVFNCLSFTVSNQKGSLLFFFYNELSAYSIKNTEFEYDDIMICFHTF